MKKRATKKPLLTKRKGTRNKDMASRKKIIIGIVAAIAIITIAGSIGILMNKQPTSPAVDAAAPNPTTLESLDIGEYGISLNYDARYGEATYAVGSRDLGDGTSVPSINITNASLKTTKDGCTLPDYTLIGNIEVFMSVDSTQYSVDNSVKVGDKYFVFNYPKTNTPVDDKCFDRTLEEKSGVQKQSLYDSFNAFKANTATQ